MKRIALILAFVLFLFGSYPSSARQIKVATYNVQNLFDLVKDGTEYEDYIPNNRLGWDKKTAEIKYKNIAKVIKDLSADIIALQEVESRRALKRLRDRLCKEGLCYKFMAIADTKSSAVKCALLSRFPIISKKEIFVRNASRSILAVKLLIEGKILIVYVNHWKSKRGPESMRLPYARALRRAIDQLPKKLDFILLGDFNSNYNEYMTFLHHQDLNDTHGLTGINHILLTLKNGRLVTERDLMMEPSCRYLYNLWLELPPSRRWSYNLFGWKGTPDHIIIPASLYDDAGISYMDNSFRKFAPHYLFRHHGVFQWQRAEYGRGKHLGRGYSDHLPLYAWFSTTEPPKGRASRYLAQ